MNLIEFKNLSNQEKWKMAELINEKVIWCCPNCNEIIEDGFVYADPFPDLKVCCSECDAVLTQRTGGGQNDPFNYIFRLR